MDIINLKPDYMSLLIGVNDVSHELLEPFVLEGEATAATEAEPEHWDYFRTEMPLRADAAKHIAEKYNIPFIALQDIFDDACKKDRLLIGYETVFIQHPWDIGLLRMSG